MRIIYEGDGGIAAFIAPAPSKLDKLSGSLEQKMVALANQILPAGTKYEIIDDQDIPADHTHRAGWQYVSGPNEKIAGDV